MVEYTAPLMNLIDWTATDSGNVEILNNTKDLYRFFDCTLSCAFIYKCVVTTIKETLPNELKYLSSFDKAYKEISEVVDMPDNKIKSLIGFILQNDSKLSKKKKEKYYQELTQEEIKIIEDIISVVFLKS